MTPARYAQRRLLGHTLKPKSKPPLGAHLGATLSTVRAFRGATEMTFHTIRAALCAARRFHNLHGSRGYVYRAEPCLFGKGFYVRVMASRGVFLTFI